VTPLLVTPGDPRGIGPEVTAAALATFRERPVVVVGDEAAVRRWGLPDRIRVVDPGDDDEPVEVAALRYAVEACLSGRGAAVVTGPIHKARLAARGFPHAGHTGFLAALSGVSDPVMAFVGGRVRVSLVTVHIPLQAVSAALTIAAVAHTIRTTAAALRSQLGLPTPRLVVCGLNPHAGDAGLLGSEDADVVAPAVAIAQGEGLAARGPVSAETAFADALAGRADAVVAMYHDQGLAPLKALQAALGGPDRSVNWTLGLPILRCGVDHGTADDIAGRGVADPSSMRAALAFAARLSAASAPAPTTPGSAR